MHGAGVGRIVLFNVGEGDRPMIITRVHSPTCVNGRVILDGWNDNHLSFGTFGTFGIKKEKVEYDGSDCHVVSVNRGPNLGEWRFYDD